MAEEESNFEENAIINKRHKKIRQAVKMNRVWLSGVGY